MFPLYRQIVKESYMAMDHHGQQHKKLQNEVTESNMTSRDGVLTKLRQAGRSSAPKIAFIFNVKPHVLRLSTTPFCEG